MPPGELVAWDPSAAHSGSAPDERPWTSRLVIVETAGLSAYADDEDTALPLLLEFPDPVIADPPLARAFVRMHIALERQATRLEQDEHLLQWFTLLTDHAAATPRPTT